MRENGGVCDVVVVGAGPAGLLAAGRAAQLGARVVLLERNARVGMKLRITGKGRCNITNTKTHAEFMRGVYGDVAIAEAALAQFGHSDIVALLHAQGVETLLERGDRVYPVSGRASDVAEALLGWCQGHGVQVHLSAPVVSLARQDELWRVGLAGEGGQWHAPSVVLACGGKSYPATGSDGAGYALADQVGLRITALLPGLVGFHTAPRLVRRERLAVRNAGLSAYSQGHLLGREQGDLELTPEGIAGPITLRLSRAVVAALHEGAEVVLSMDAKPALSPGQLERRLARDVATRGAEPMLSVARAWLPAPMVEATLRLAGIAPQLRAERLTDAQRARLAETMKGYRLRVIEPEGWERAVVTRGGVDSQGLEPTTLQAKDAPGLYVCGEMLDIDAASGGYNLQLAYSTGWLAGTGAAANVLPTT